MASGQSPKPRFIEACSKPSAGDGKKKKNVFIFQKLGFWEGDRHACRPIIVFRSDKYGEAGDCESLEGKRTLGWSLESRVRVHSVQVHKDSFLTVGTAHAKAEKQEKASRLGSQLHILGLAEEQEEAGVLGKGTLERHRIHCRRV